MKMGNILRIFTIFKTNSLLISSVNQTNFEYHYVIFEVEYSKSLALLYIMNRKFKKISSFNSVVFKLIESFTKNDYYKISISDADNMMSGNNLINNSESM